MHGIDYAERERREVRNGVATSVVVHVLAFVLLGWWLGADAAMAAMLKELRAAAAAQKKEEPQVSMIHPEQILQPAPPPPELRPKLGMKAVIASSAAAPEAAPAGKADFQSDRSTRAASRLAADPDSMNAMPTLRGGAAGAATVVTQSAGQAGPKPTSQPVLAQLTPREPSALPEMKAAKPLAQMIEDLERAGTTGKAEAKLPFEVKKPLTGKEQPPEMKAPDEGFIPMSRSSSVKGSITERGPDAVNAEATPLGRYAAKQNAILAGKWEAATKRKKLPPSRVTLHFFINAAGRVEEPEVLAKQGPEPQLAEVVDLALGTALGVIFEQPAPDLLSGYADGRLPMNYDFTLD